MTLEELMLRRLQGQHLLQTADTRTVVKDLCGVQAQFLSHALHGLGIRCGQVNTEELVKSWTNRGTMHLFSADDLPLFLYQGRTHFLRDVDTLESDAFISRERKAYFADLLVSAIGEGVDDRESLKILCERNSMTDSEAKSLFDPWGGLIRALCESGRICHRVQEKKAYALCPAFEPMCRDDAQRELLRRYFTHFGPATVKDAAYFFGWTQAQVKALLPHLPVSQAVCENRVCYFMDNGPLSDSTIPSCLFLAGFDQLMLGYEKKENPFLPAARTGDIFTRSGIVRPALLLDGTVKGYWNLKDNKLRVTLFEEAHREHIHASAKALWPELRDIRFG